MAKKGVRYPKKKKKSETQKKTRERGRDMATQGNQIVAEIQPKPKTNPPVAYPQPATHTPLTQFSSATAPRPPITLNRSGYCCH